MSQQYRIEKRDSTLDINNDPSSTANDFGSMQLFYCVSWPFDTEIFETVRDKPTTFLSMYI